jgi:hypothetical protein
MDHQKASAVLIKLLEKKSLSAEEKEAVSTALGVLAWTSLAQSKIRGMGRKRNRLKNSKVKSL